MKKPIAILILLSLLILVAACFESSKAQSQAPSGQVTINADGTISPQTTLIQQTGNTYKITDNINTQITITLQKSNIKFDGDGHVVGNGIVGRIVFESVENVTVRNFTLNTGWVDCIVGYNSSNIIIQNNTLNGGQDQFGQRNGIVLMNCNSSRILDNSIQGSMCGILLMGCKDNVIAGNTIQAVSSWTWGNYPSAIMIDLRYLEETVYSSGSSNNLIYNNAFMGNRNLTEIYGTSSNSWDNGKIGNYWGNYLTKYPNAVEVDSSGIGNTPYVIDSKNIDHYPLMSQADIIIPVPTTNPTSFTALSPTPTPTVPEFPWLMILPLFASLLFCVVLVRFRNRLNKNIE